MTNTIIYDGNCKFCKRFADWCIKSNTGFNAISVRESEAKEKLHSLGIKFINLQTIYFIENEIVFIRSKAIFRICSFLTYPWKVVSLFTYLPVSVTDFFYKLFAKYRYYF